MATIIVFNLGKSFPSNHLHVQCFDSTGSFAAVSGLLLKSIFRIMSTCYLKIFIGYQQQKFPNLLRK